MKPNTLPVKRKPAPKGIFKRLSAVTRNRKQRVAATANPEMESEDSSSKISRALTIIFLIHIVAIGLIFIHQKFLDGRSSGDVKTVSTGKPETVARVAAVAPREDLPRLTTGEEPYVVSQGDNYTRIAAELGVDEGDLRLINNHVDIVSGRLLKIPPKRAVGQHAPAVASISQPTQPVAEAGMVENVDVSNVPRAQLVRPVHNNATAAQPKSAVSSGKSYVVQSGDSVWRIANRFKVNQDALMKANGISDARKMKVGMSLTIP
jgi:LysM repeat protein